MGAIRENRSVRQRPDEGFRRWFLNDFFDLIVWYESARSEMTGFQLCYSRHVDEKAFTWQRGKQSSHYVSAGSDERLTPWIATAILHGDAGAIPEAVLERLVAEQGDLDDELLQVVVERAREYNKRYSAE